MPYDLPFCITLPITDRPIANMKVALISYPGLFQRVGGLQVQIKETAAALRDLGIEAEIPCLVKDRLVDFDLVHVFGSGNGNHRLVDLTKSLGRPVVVSSLIHAGWSKLIAHRIQLIDRLVGRLSSWELRTNFRDSCFALGLADRVVALSQAERDALVDWYGVTAERIHVIPNGISPMFFLADPAPFRKAYALNEPFVLCVGAISERKNQLGLVRALRGTGVRIVLIGPAIGSDKHLLGAACSEGNVLHIPFLANDDPMLASAYAAATVTALVSTSEVMPLCVLESLAAGTPVVVTRHHQMGLASERPGLVEVDPYDPRQIRAAVLSALESSPDPNEISRSVEALSWGKVARALKSCYEECLVPRPRISLDA